MTAIRVALCADYLEEQWPSMDRVAAMLHEQLERSHAATIHSTVVRPPFARRAIRVPMAGESRLAFNTDRFLNRFWDYPRAAAQLHGDFDIFHIIDHSYAHLVHALPAERAVVTCHDLDAFRSILQPHQERRSAAFRSKTADILTGLQRAARVTCDTTAIRDELATRGLVAEDRLVVAPLGVAPVFSPRPDADADLEAAQLITRSLRYMSSMSSMSSTSIELLHIGSAAPRKRLDVLLRVFGAVRSAMPDVRLIRVGDPFTREQFDLAQSLGIGDSIVTLTGVDESTLAALYRRAALVLVPSEREGFGLPVIEAMACGAPVVASDIAVLREVGGGAAEYCPVADVACWSQKIGALLCERRDDPDGWKLRRERGRARAAAFTWHQFAATVAAVYSSISGIRQLRSA